VSTPDAPPRDDRKLVRARLDVAEKITAIKAQVQGLLKRHQLRREATTGKGWTRLFCAWLRSLTLLPPIWAWPRRATKAARPTIARDTSRIKDPTVCAKCSARRRGPACVTTRPRRRRRREKALRGAIPIRPRGAIPIRPPPPGQVWSAKPPPTGKRTILGTNDPICFRSSPTLSPTLPPAHNRNIPLGPAAIYEGVPP
jgi:hypothetical protein